MHRFARASAALLIALTPVSALAGPFADAATSAEAQAATDPAAAASSARAALSQFVAGLPFQLVNPVFLAAPAGGFGIYDAREPVFKAGEPLVTYAEVIGTKWVEGGRGFVSGFDVDLELLDKEGTVLGGQEGFGSFTFDSRTPLHEIFTTLTLTADGIEPGDYVVRYVFTDRNSSEKTEFKQDFTITP
jgi:hypothetical protein